jgi:hypothetical protein
LVTRHSSGPGYPARGWRGEIRYNIIEENKAAKKTAKAMKRHKSKDGMWWVSRDAGTSGNASKTADSFQ